MNSICFKVNAVGKITSFIELLMKTSSLALLKQQTCLTGSSGWVLYLLEPFLLTPLQSVIKQCCSSVLARSLKTLLSHNERAGTSFFVLCLQLLWGILATVLYVTLDGKILKILVCNNFFFPNLTFWRYYMKHINTMVSIFPVNC